mgnify:CR=1 FL=1
MASQGWPSSNCPEYGDLLPFERDKEVQSEHNQRILMGNGMHLSQVGSVMSYLMSFLMTKSDGLDFWPIEKPIVPTLPEKDQQGFESSTMS